MKKIILTLLVALCSLHFSIAASGNETVEKIVLYLPNRIVDAFDMFSVNLGIGPRVQLELMGTRLVGGGVNAGVSANLFKDCNRQIGWGMENGWRWEVPGLLQEDMERSKTSRLVQSYWENYFGMPKPDQSVYEWQRGARDYWQLGGAIGLLVNGELYLNPIDIADFALGFFFIDIKDDDLTFENFQ